MFMKCNFKRVLGVVLAVLLLCQCFLFSAPLVSAEETELPPSNAIPINSVYELSMICNEYPSDGYYYLASDLDMTEEVGEYGDFYNDGAGWEPIGTSSTPFTGTFDGQGYKIIGLKINRDNDYIGLFGYANGAKIFNVELEDCNISGQDYVSGILGYGKNTTVSDCKISGKITGVGYYVAAAGGYLESENTIVLSNCTNTADIVSNAGYIGGLFGKISGNNYTIKNCINSGSVKTIGTEHLEYIGGIVGSGEKVDIDSCENKGVINTTAAGYYVAYIGGISGKCADISNCINRGNVRGVMVGSVGPGSGKGLSGGYIGGVAGYANAISKSFNTGSVYGSGGQIGYYDTVGTINTHLVTRWTTKPMYVGGIAGTSNISQCYNMGAVSGNSYGYAGSLLYSGVAQNCFSNTKTAIPLFYNSISSSSKYLYNANGTISKSGSADNCYYYANEELGAGSLRTTRQLRAKATYADWDFETVWTMEGNEDYMYPEFIGMPVEFEKTLISISIGDLPDKTNYIEGKDTLDLTGAKLKLNYDNETSEEIDITADMVTGFDNTIIGSQKINVSYKGFTTNFPVVILVKSLDSIKISTTPSKLQYLECKDELDVSDGVITLFYNNDTTATVSMDKATITGFDNTVVGSQELTVKYGGKTTTFSIEILPKSLVSISVSKTPNKLTYLEGKDKLNLTGGEITLLYDNDQQETVPMSETTVIGFNNKRVGTQTLTVFYRNFDTTFDVEVTAKTVSYIVIAKQPDTLVFLEDKDELNVSGGQIRVVYNNDTEEIIDIEKDMVSGYDNSVVGMQTLIITYEGSKTYYEVEIIAKKLIDVSLNDLPAKLVYREQKDKLDVTGGRLLLTYNNDTKEYVELNLSMVKGFDNTIVGKQTLTIEYKGYTLEYEIEIIAKSVVSISITATPYLTTYLEAKDNLNVAGGRVVIYYDNDTSEIVDMTSDMVSGFDNTQIGNQTLTVNIQGKTATFDIFVKAKSINAIEITEAPEKITYYVDTDTIEITGGTLRVYYDNNTTQTKALSSDNINYSFDIKPQEQRITVEYEGVTTSFNAIVYLHMIGDVDGDGQVSVIDATMIQRHMAKLTTISEEKFSCADTDKNTKISIMDATVIQRFIAQLIPSL